MAYSDYIVPILSGIGSLWQAYNSNSGKSAGFDAMKANEDRRYADYLAERQYYDQYTMAQYEQEQAARAAGAAAAAKNAAAKSAAEKKAFGSYKKDNRKIQKLWEPYAQTGQRLLPQMEQTYGNSLNNMNLLSAYMSSPQYQQSMNQSVPAYETNIPLPDYLKYGK
jgi:hypothetical protein